MKHCETCKLELPLEQFHKKRKNKDGHSSKCRTCQQKYKDIYYKKNKEKIAQSRQKYYSDPQNRIKLLLGKVKERSAISGIEFNISPEDLEIPHYCPYLNVPLTHWIGRGHQIYNSSIDRIDSSRGYTKGNVQVISLLANQMKNSANNEQLVNFAINVLRMEGTTVEKYAEAILKGVR